MMKCVLEEISLRTDKNMTKKSAKVFAELADVEDFHFKGDLWDGWYILSYSEGRSKSSKPGGHEPCVDHDFIGPYGCD